MATGNTRLNEDAGEGRFASALKILPPIPVFPLQLVLALIVRRMAARRPELFDRLGSHGRKSFLIDPVDVPLCLILRPDPRRPVLRAVRRSDRPVCDARIAGPFFKLMGLVDGRTDGDALFFSRALVVEGDTEAVVCLRNALDDVDGSVIEDIAGLLGAPGRVSLNVLRRMEARYGHRL